jgi:hypothetical protein
MENKIQFETIDNMDLCIIEEKSKDIKIIDHVDLFIIEERTKDIGKINKDLHQINEIYIDLAKIVNQQAPMVDKLQTNAVKTNGKTKEGLKHITKANQYNKSNYCIIS